MKKTKSAFTLAEVLIVLVIIGTVASLTIPALIENAQKEEWSTQLKKTYATLENARRLTSIDYDGDISELFDNSDETYGNKALQAFAKHLNLAKNCETSSGCWYDGLKFLNGQLFYSTGYFDSLNPNLHGRAILADGTLIRVVSNHKSCTDSNLTQYSPKQYDHYCGYIVVDMNGQKGPNTIGRDVFQFDITLNGIYPAGSQYSDDEINTSCQPSQAGWPCTQKVIREGTENY